MTNYNERLDEVLDNVLIGMYCTNPDGDFVPLDDRNNVLRAEAKQAITSLIKELVAEARIDELKHLTDDDGIWYQDMARQFPQKITLNQRIKELEAWTN